MQENPKACNRPTFGDSTGAKQTNRIVEAVLGKVSRLLEESTRTFLQRSEIQWCKHPKFCLLDPVESKGLLPESLVLVCGAQVLGKYVRTSYEVPGMPFQDIVK